MIIIKELQKKCEESPTPNADVLIDIINRIITSCARGSITRWIMAVSTNSIPPMANMFLKDLANSLTEYKRVNFFKYQNLITADSFDYDVKNVKPIKFEVGRIQPLRYEIETLTSLYEPKELLFISELMNIVSSYK